MNDSTRLRSSVRSVREVPQHALIRTVLLLLALAACTTLFAACASLDMANTPMQQVSFATHRANALASMRGHRDFQTQDHDAELAWNAPQEWAPEHNVGLQGSRKGILLVHGLGDSPWSFHDLAPQLAAQGFVVRTVLLPGHGTRPQDLLNVDAEDWQQLVNEQALALQHEVGTVFLGGFSTGANLVLDYAYAHPDIAGLVLFSPGFKSLPFDWLAPLASRVRPWMITPDASESIQNAVRYMNVPTNGFAQFYRTSANARRLLREGVYDKPVFMAVAEHDSVLDSEYLLDVFQRRFTHPQSRMIWYGKTPDGLVDSARVIVREDSIPEQKISQFSHMGLIFSPDNALYGAQGNLRVCLNGMDAAATKACELGADVWYSDWGYREPGKIHARLTFNPYFDWQGQVMLTVLDGK